MWYRIIKSQVNDTEDLKIPAFLLEGEENIKSPLFSNLESQLEEIRTGEDPLGISVEKGQGGMYMKNGEGTYQYSSGKGAPMFQDNFPSSKQLI
jgi:hypothetical protein